jgi:hypothetical protein
MHDELENLFGMKIIPCPHCGTKNAENAESCLLCGKPIGTAPSPAPETSPETGTDLPDTHEIPVPVMTDEPEADAMSMDRTLRKKVTRLWIAVAAVLSLILSVTALVVVQTTSPAHDVVRYYHNGDGYKMARDLYLQKVEGKWPHQQIFNAKMLDHFDAQYNNYWALLNAGLAYDIDVMYRYIAHIRSVLRTCNVPELVADTRRKFDTIADAVYADYLESEWEYNRAKTIMGWIAETGYCSDETQARFVLLQKVPEMEQKLSEGRKHEAKGKYYYPEAIAAYRQAVEHPRSGAEAQASVDRCLTDYRNYVRNSLDGDQKWTARAYENDLRVLENAITKLGGDEQLEQERDRVEAAYGTLLRHEVLNAVLRPDMNDNHPTNTLQQANKVLEYFPGDREVLAARTMLIFEVKQSLRKTIREDAVFDINWVWIRVQSILELMPDDAEMQQLKAQFDRYMENGLHICLDEDAENPGFTKWFLEGIRGGKDGGETVTDATGRTHDKFNLYQLCDTTTAEAWMEVRAKLKAGEDHPHLTFTTAPTKNFTGTGRVRVYRQPNVGEDAPVLLYESPLLTGTSAELTVDLPVTKGVVVRIALEAETGTAEVLLDDAYIENNPPTGK